MFIRQRRTLWTSEHEAKLTAKKEALAAYRDAELSILKGGRAYAYTIGPRNKTNYPINLDQARKAIKELEDEIVQLEALKSGSAMPRTRAVIPRDI